MVISGRFRPDCLPVVNRFATKDRGLDTRHGFSCFWWRASCFGFLHQWGVPDSAPGWPRVICRPSLARWVPFPHFRGCAAFEASEHLRCEGWGGWWHSHTVHHEWHMVETGCWSWREFVTFFDWFVCRHRSHEPRSQILRGSTNDCGWLE